MTRRPARAQSLVEFALVIPIFTLLMLALFDWSRVFAIYISMANATREASRRAQTISNPTTHRVYADCSLSGGVTPCSDMQPTVNAALNSYTLPIGPGGFYSQNVCLFDPGSSPTPTQITTCTATTNNGPEYASDGAALVVSATYQVQFLPMMSAILPNGLLFTTSTVVYLE